MSKFHPMFKVLPVLLLVMVTACVPPTNKETKIVDIDYTVSDIKDLIELRHAGSVDSLAKYFNSDNATLRYLAAESFASIKSPESLSSLNDLLSDPSSEVRAMAAYAIGQQGDASAVDGLIDGFRGKDTISVDNELNGKILEAIGKIDDDTRYLKFMAQQDKYRDSDTILLTNQARGIYRYALKGKVIPEGTKKMVDMALNANLPRAPRLYAAHYLSRAKGLDVKKYQFRLANQFVRERDRDIKMALALSLKNAEANTGIKDILYDGLELANDDRVKINILRALPRFGLNDTVITNLAETTDNAAVKEAIANFYGNFPDAEIAPLIRQKAKEATDTTYKAKLYKAYLDQVPHYYTQSRNAARYEIQQCLDGDLTEYEKVGFINALGSDLQSYALLDDMVSDTMISEPVKTAVASSVTRIATSEDFNKVFASSPRYARLKLLSIIEKIVEGGDVGALYEITPALRDPQISRLIDSTTFIENALDKLVLPRDYETYKVLHETVDILNDTTTQSRYEATFQPIRWDILETINDNTEFIVKTDRGLITLQMFPDKAPESVANFARLVDEKFYDGKVFHRIVPNFVAQAGCTRGDGYGSINTTIHSEVTDLYYDREGYLGMASAGPDTESAQWFITLSPTPHLDGRYTIFGKVKQGMSTVLELEVGDEIQDIIRRD